MIEVTNLNDSGPGSLRAAVEAAHPVQRAVQIDHGPAAGAPVWDALLCAIILSFFSYTLIE